MMLKKILKLLKFLAVFTIWTYLYVQIAGSLIYGFWSFNILSSDHWKFMVDFWNRGGIIQTSTDYIFFICIISLIPAWILSLKYFYKMDYINALLSPVRWYNAKSLSKYSKNSSKIVLKNMGVTKKVTMEDLINNKMAKINKDEANESLTIRQQIQNKINSAKN